MVAPTRAESFGRGNRADVGIDAAGVREVRFGRVFVHRVASFVAGAYSVGVLSMPALGHFFCISILLFFFSFFFSRGEICAFSFHFVFSSFSYTPSLILSFFLPFFPSFFSLFSSDDSNGGSKARSD